MSSHILVVDDEHAAAREVARILQSLGHRTTVCTTWTDALRCFTAEDVDLVLMDAIMPTVNGFKLTKIMRSRATTYVPIVFLTALTDTASREHGISVGADDFLCKPIDPLELRVRLTAMLRIRSLTKDLEAKTRALSRIASVDALTGVGNRRSFDERLSLELAHARDAGEAVSLLLLDVDHFKRVNDHFGHAVGDELLASLGRMLGEITRACDLPFRYGGEEFAVIATDTHSAQATFLGERLRGAFALRTRAATACGPQTVSIGIAGTDQLDPGAHPHDLIVGADTALYRAKASGRNCVRVYDLCADRSAA